MSRKASPQPQPSSDTPAPELSLSVQYAVAAPELSRGKLRRWVTRALAGAMADPDCPALDAAALTIRLVDAEEGRQLNHDFRQKDYATNVLTFEYGVDPDGVLHADIIFCLPVLAREAAEQGKTLQHHAAHLTVHGVLHALGYDHLDDAEAAAMEALETRILAKMRISDPYA